MEWPRRHPGRHGPAGDQSSRTDPGPRRVLNSARGGSEKQSAKVEAGARGRREQSLGRGGGAQRQLGTWGPLGEQALGKQRLERGEAARESSRPKQKPRRAGAPAHLSHGAQPPPQGRPAPGVAVLLPQVCDFALSSASLQNTRGLVVALTSWPYHLPRKASIHCRRRRESESTVFDKQADRM